MVGEGTVIAIKDNLDPDTLELIDHSLVVDTGSSLVYFSREKFSDINIGDEVEFYFNSKVLLNKKQ